ncbi:MAG: M48 family metallopeptidase [Lysobacterales bacterium]
MNFFQYQDQARRQTRWLVFLFILAVVAIIVVIDFALLVGFGISGRGQQQAVFNAETLRANLPVLLAGALITAAVITLASLFKTLALRSGGGAVARELGGTLIRPDTHDPLQRRLYNVVEEIALASGIPVPEIYVLEQESGINAFAAGFTPSDAAVAVTRGALEKLDRNELQGVIAHEFSHIFNGDMRLNIRLMGALFGILVLSLLGRRVLHGSYYMGRSRNSNGAAIMMAALAVMVVGYVGLFFGRWIKAAVSRQREYLADASAVQFTRDPGGIGGALKKIAVYSEASYLNAETEEVSHMLFGDGQPMGLFSTHPPLNERIRRIDPSFQPDELVQLAEKVQHERESRADGASAQPRAHQHGGAPVRAGNVVDAIGKPDFSHLLLAATLAASIPETINRAAHAREWATEVLLYCLLGRDPELRERQLLIIARRMGSDSEERVRGLLRAEPAVASEQRLPLLEIAWPELKRRPPDYVRNVLATVKSLNEADGRIDVFEYLLAKLIELHLWESANPQRVKMSGKRTLAELRPQAETVLAVLAARGQRDPDAVERAFRAGLAEMAEDTSAALPQIDDWCAALDHGLASLDSLKPGAKQKLVNALVATVMADDRIAVQEMELLRLVCAVIHVPLPMMTPNGDGEA